MPLDVVSLIVGAFGGVLTLALVRRLMGRLGAGAAQNGAQAASGRTWNCTCGQRFYAEQDAKEHAIDTHNAHPEEWRPIMEVA